MPGKEDLENERTEGKRYASVKPIVPPSPFQASIEPPPVRPEIEYPPEVLGNARKRFVVTLSRLNIAHDKIFFVGNRVIEILFKSGLILGIYLLLVHLAESRGIKLPFPNNIWSILVFPLFYLILDITVLYVENTYLSRYIEQTPWDKTPWVNKPWN